MDTKTITAPTQTLRNIIEDARYGAAGADDLHAALLELEAHLNLPLTQAQEPL